MSASEKLKALEARGAFGAWSVYEEEHDSGGDTYVSRWIAEDNYPSTDGTKHKGVLLSLDPSDLTRERAEFLAALRNALPQIVAVVEAGEKAQWADHTGYCDFIRECTCGLSELRRSLAVLEEALT